MKPRLTPLNFIIAVLMVTAVFQIFNEGKGHSAQALYFILMACTCFIADLIFRRFLIDLKRIWIIELLFIIFAAVIFALIRH